MTPKAIVLLSGGLDSATCMAWAAKQYQPIALSFDYGQQHASELDAAKRIASAFDAPHHVIDLSELGKLGGSALTDPSLELYTSEHTPSKGIPLSYVPARNTLFLSYALALSEVNGAQHIVIGVNAVDYSGYPDCRPEFINAYERMANLATKAQIEGGSLHIHTPLIALSKAQIISLGTSLGVDYSLTVSCYQANAAGQACGRCDSCLLRKKGFEDAGLTDPTCYQ